MPRRPRFIEKDVPVHVVARGNYQQPVFLREEDRASYLELLAKHAEHFDLAILGWCLMTNHIHLIAVPPTETALSEVMKRVQGQYSLRLNTRAERGSGHSWQARFYSCSLAGHLWTALRYVELNPVRANLVERGESSHWSSAPFHCGLKHPPAMLRMNAWSETWTPERWRDVLHYGPQEREIEAIRTATRLNRPLETFTAAAQA